MEEHIWFSKLISSLGRYREDFLRIELAMKERKIAYGYLEGTNDIWCRDYMPIRRTDGRLIQFRYEPSYLQGYERLGSDTAEICRLNGIKTAYSNINLDGGNVLIRNGKALISDRIFRENPQCMDRHQLIANIESVLDTEMLLVPQINSDMTGHVDGYMRWYTDDTVLLTQPDIEHAYWQRNIKRFLEAHRLKAIKVPAFIYREKGYSESAIGGYVNYLIVDDLLLLPVFDVPGNRDEEVIGLFESLFPQLTLVPIVMNSIARAGGLIHCVTWEG